MFGDCHRQQNRYSPQVILGKLIKDYSYSFGFAKNNVTVTAPGGIPRARMNCGNQLQLQVLIPVELSDHHSYRIRSFLN